MEWALFKGIAPEQIRAVLSLARRRRFSRGEIVFHEGDPGDTLHLIDWGHVAVWVTTPLGDAATPRIIGAGEYFGKLAVISPRAAQRDAHRVGGDGDAGAAPRPDQPAPSRAPDGDRLLLEPVLGEVRRMSGALLEARYVPVPTRLARQLVSLACSYPGDAKGRVVIPLTQDDLAGLCGTTRPTVNELLGSSRTERC